MPITDTPHISAPDISEFGYDISDYTNVDPQYGTLADFDRLRAEAEKRHIRLILDMILNHTSDQSAWFNRREVFEMADDYSRVKTVVQVLNDGEKGFLDIGEHLESPKLKAFFIEESGHRGKFAKEAEAESAIAAGDTKDIGGTATGAIHRTWGDLKAHLGGGDHTLLETAEQGEDAAKKAYKEALEGTVPSPKIHELLLR
jgi:uncharacterized protein (TIGR02284 family)